MEKTTIVYTLEELERLLNVTKRTLYNYIKDGKLQAVKMGKYWRVRGDQLDAFLSSDTGSRYMSADSLNPDTWTDEDRAFLDKAMRLSPDDRSFLIKILAMTSGDGGDAVAEFIEREAPHYRLSTPEGQHEMIEAIKAAGLIKE